jgi:hypothetical protein
VIDLSRRGCAPSVQQSDLQHFAGTRVLLIVNGPDISGQLELPSVYHR